MQLFARQKPKRILFQSLSRLFFLAGLATHKRGAEDNLTIEREHWLVDVAVEELLNDTEKQTVVDAWIAVCDHIVGSTEYCIPRFLSDRWKRGLPHQTYF